jgi:hypothetical protein
LNAEDAKEIATVVPEIFRLIQLNQFDGALFCHGRGPSRRGSFDFDWVDSLFDWVESGGGSCGVGLPVFIRFGSGH